MRWIFEKRLLTFRKSRIFHAPMENNNNNENNTEEILTKEIFGLI